MIPKFSRRVSSIKLDRSGKYCLIQFYPQKLLHKWNSNEDSISDPIFYTIVEVELLKAYGGVPDYCLLVPAESKLEQEVHFKIDEDCTPALFEGTKNPGKFWIF